MQVGKKKKKGKRKKKVIYKRSRGWVVAVCTVPSGSETLSINQFTVINHSINPRRRTELVYLPTLSTWVPPSSNKLWMGVSLIYPPSPLRCLMWVGITSAHSPQLKGSVASVYLL